MIPKCRALVGNRLESCVIYAGETRAFILNTQKKECIGVVPVEADTNHRVAFGPAPGSCIVGSWKKPLCAWNYEEATLLWTSDITHIQTVSSFGSGQIKVLKKESIVLDAQNGGLLTSFPGMDTYKHPNDQIMVSFDFRKRNIHIDIPKINGSATFKWDTFAILAHAWSASVFVAADPTGEIRAYSLKHPVALMEQLQGAWFNIPSLCFNHEANAFFGLATDWEKRCSTAII